MDTPSPLWRSLDEPLADSREEGEAGRGIFNLTRRDFLKLAAASAALASAGCRGPVEEIVPYVRPAEGEPGVPRFFATAMTLGGCATGLLVECNMGRPTKIEGNPAHPASLGASGVFEQAAILELWDPERAAGIAHAGQPATRVAMKTALLEAAGAQGDGLRILMRYSSSPTLAAQLEALRARFPGMRVHTWEPLHRDNSLAGARLAFGRAVEPVYRFANADVVVSLDADFVGEGPGHLRYARDFIARRRPGDRTPMNRLYAVESSPTLTGVAADHRLALSPAAMTAWLVRLASALHGEQHAGSPLADAVAADLASHRGRVLIVPGESLTPAAHALVHRLNAELGATGSTVDYIEPVCGDLDCTESLLALAQDLEAGRVKALLVLGGNPVYDAPRELELAELIRRAPFSLHLGLRDDETSAACAWHVPQAHFLEQWSDTRAFDGTASVVQPVVAPLYGGIAAHELLADLLGAVQGGPRDWVRARWTGGEAAVADRTWRELLRGGIVPDSAARPVAVTARGPSVDVQASRGWTLLFRADPSLRDGEFANNAWLQELPRSHSKLTWDNAACVSPGAAAKLGVKTGDLLDITAGDERLRAPAWVLPGQDEDTITLPLGYGRQRAGKVGNGVGFDAYRLRHAHAPWWREASEVRKAEGSHDFATTQNHARMEGREPVRRFDVAAVIEGRQLPHVEDEPSPETLYPEWTYDSYRWGMVVDLTACIGCNACTIACQAENNIATVGKEEVARGREMHWIRVDRYYEGPPEKPRTYFQPVPCMQCENAPCEPVCPVGATVHDSEGINVQVYNRCVGTRFCSNNCPYKVRRFNFLHYAKRDGEPPLDARNPQVTLRMRGVMEKCNYCLQRITRARIETGREGRRIADGEVVTACQAACPTRAITFGDMNDPQSAVSLAKRSRLDYALLHELDTRPRTTYHARVANPNPGVKDA